MKASILVHHAVLALEMRSQASLVRGNLLFDSFSIRIMNALEPLLRCVADFVFLIAQHGLPTRGKMDNIGQQVPVPQAVIRAQRRQRIPLFAFLQRFLRMFMRKLSSYAS